MVNRSALLLAAGITGFLVVLVGGFTLSLAQMVDPPLDQASTSVNAQSERALNQDATTDTAVSYTETITEEEAVAIATAYLGRGKAVKVERERERNVAAFEVKFADGSEVYVDETTGDVVYSKIKHEKRESQSRVTYRMDRDDD